MENSVHSDSENAAFLNTQYQKEDRQQRRNYMYLMLFNLFLFTLSMLSLICTVMSQKDTAGHSAAALYDQFNLFSPAMHVVEYSKKKFEIPSPLNSSVYVGISNDTENAWMDVAYLPDQMISKKDFPKLDMPDDAMQVTDPKTGETGYRVGLEVFHQLHCLNMLRMATIPEYYTKVEWSDTNDKPEIVRAHLDHCIEVLRINLMCMSDVNVFTFHPREGYTGYWPQYNAHHVCRNFDAIKDWANANAMPYAEV
ncbi:tat pathway signal sequence [Pyrenophora seminiperda CCB06]|uniref:Tat pathway signal sequence n=1 Tax=Pyrenophora seminiperda CCB06 TaxID=1302712 RepID=A0A3M7M6J0_9PLEO|nr:tat pathway signal sequence [Pyrenophora seminiperda CCB06]